MMLTKKIGYLTLSPILLLMFIFIAGIAHAKQEDPFDLDIIDDTKYISNLEAVQPIQPLSKEDPDGYIDVQPDHWAYRAVKYLTDIGLLGGYEDGMFRGDRPITRYELSLIIAKLVQNYNDYIQTGKFGEPLPIPLPQNQVIAEIPVQQASSQPLELTSIKKANTVSNQNTTNNQNEAGQFKHGKMKLLGSPSDKKETSAKPSETPPKEEKKPVDKQLEKKKATVTKELKLDKKLELTDKDVEILNALIEYLGKDYKKQVTKDLEDKLRKIDRLNQQNKRDIEQLEQDIDRFKISGGGYAQYTSTDYSNSSNSASVDYSSWWSWTSKPRKYEDMTLSSGSELHYTNYKASRDVNRNFKIRTLYGGPNSYGVLVTPLITTGLDYYGFKTEVALNKYTIVSSLGRISSNNYLNGSSLQFSLFNEPRSLCYLSHIQSWEDADKVSNAKKNSATSLSIRYPLPLQGLFFTGEYAHSTYHRPEVKYAFPDKSPDYDEEDQFLEWIRLPEQTYQDDAFFVFLDYNKGPWTIFPAGYLRIGPKYYSRYLGLPGMSLSNFGVSFLPISLQSLELWALIGSYKRVEKKYEDSYIFAMAKEIKPMFFDTSALSSSGSDMDTLVSLNLFARLNNRGEDGLIKLQYIQNKLTFYQSDKITYSWTWSTAKGGLGPTCIDGNYTYVYDDQRNVIDAFIGNGRANCDLTSPQYDDSDLEIMLRFLMRSNDFNIFWRTSNRSELSIDYGFDDMRLNATSNVAAIQDAVTNLVSQGRTYSMGTNLKYRLTDVSDVNVWYKTYNMPRGTDLQDSSKHLYNTVGAKISMSF